MSFRLASLAAFCVLGVGNLLHIVGLATPEWVTVDATVLSIHLTGSAGLWSGCFNDNCRTFTGKQKPDWLKACQALAILGMLVGCFAAFLACLIFLLYLIGKESPRAVGLLSLVAAMFSFFLILICVIVYATETKEGYSGWDFGYSFGLTITGAVLIALGGCLAFAGNH